MVFETLKNNFEYRGYQLFDLGASQSAQLFFAAKKVNSIIYAVSVVNYVGFNKITSEDYNIILRNFRENIQGIEEYDFRLIQLVCTYDAQNSRGVVSGFYPYWIVDIQNEKLMIYENQPASFLDVTDIVEDTLGGTSYSLSDDFAGGTVSARSFPIITSVIILINIAVFLYLELTGSTVDVMFMLRHGALNYKAVVDNGEYYRILTHFFMHYGIEHLFNNMLVLAVIGFYFERVLGKIQFLVIYMLSGLLAGTVSLFWYNYFSEEVTSAGASGAVFGLCGVMIAYICADRKNFEKIGITRIVLFLILTLYSGFGDSGIDNVAHVTGFILGALMTFLLLRYRKSVSKQRDF